MGDQEDKPKWLIELENRKRKPKLAHEAGAGAPCLNCESACPGLDLHFWRKICKNCKCRGDNHDVDDEDFPQFELLFGPGLKRKNNRSVLLKVNDKKQIQKETPFEWIPPDITKDLAEDYMNALPTNKLPIKGSAGAVLRRQQLQKQIPLHDIDHKACDDLSEHERREFEKYLDNLKKSAGQGKVSKITTLKPFDKSLMTPANATDVQQFSPQHSQSLINPNAKLNLRTPSSFIPKDFQVPSKSNLFNSLASSIPAPHKVDVMQVQTLQATTETNSKQPQYSNPLANFSNSSHSAQTSTGADDYHSQALNNSVSEDNRNLKSIPVHHGIEHTTHFSIIASEEIPQSHQAYEPVQLNKKSNNTKSDDRLKQKLEFPEKKPTSTELSQQISSEALSLPSSMEASILGNKLNKEELSNTQNKCNKYGLNNDHVASKISADIQTISHYPSISNSEEIANNYKISEILGNKTSYNNNEYQVPSNMSATSPSGPVIAELNASLPVQSNIIHSELTNNPVFPEYSVNASIVHQNLDNINQLQNEMEGMTTNASKIHQCHNCQEDIHCGDVVVTAEKIQEAVWHPGCFVCSACNELLVDLVYFSHKDKLFCARDFAELLNIPRCFACDELIFVREYTVAEGHNYHVKHFCCWDCDIPLAERQYLTENDRPVCLSCYQINYAQTCNACNIVIAADQQGVTVKDLHFHVTENCFCCTTCKKSLLGGKISIKENKLLCSKECIAEFLHRKALGR